MTKRFNMSKKYIDKIDKTDNSDIKNKKTYIRKQ